MDNCIPRSQETHPIAVSQYVMSSPNPLFFTMVSDLIWTGEGILLKWYWINMCICIYIYISIYLYLVCGLEHEFYDFPYISNVIIPTVTQSIIFKRGRAQPPTSVYIVRSFSQETHLKKSDSYWNFIGVSPRKWSTQKAFDPSLLQGPNCEFYLGKMEVYPTIKMILTFNMWIYEYLCIKK